MIITNTKLFYSARTACIKRNIIIVSFLGNAKTSALLWKVFQQHLYNNGLVYLALDHASLSDTEFVSRSQQNCESEVKSCLLHNKVLSA